MNGQWKGTREAIEQAGLSLNEVWMRYFSISGEAGDYEVDAIHYRSAVSKAFASSPLR
jgi:hypothetical protein